jgi:DNA helicase-2/ATP-dependent DNA helicase PcrA
MIDGWKNKGSAPPTSPRATAAALPTARAGRSTQAYQERLQTLNAVDFGDLLCLPIRIFRANPDVLKEYQQKFRYILVDEYQDTNTAQYCGCGCWPSGPPASAQHLLRRRRRPVDLWLARRGGGQHPALREGFSRRPSSGSSATTAPPNISWAAAGHLIAHNEGRLGKTLFTEQSDPEHER